jgi:hypothetical protein
LYEERAAVFLAVIVAIRSGFAETQFPTDCASISPVEYRTAGRHAVVQNRRRLMQYLQAWQYPFDRADDFCSVRPGLIGFGGSDARRI